ncbi:MAG: RNA-binding S4 domain-containing protein [Nannocystaceae bacterium]
MGAGSDSNGSTGVRLDRWLWAARMFKTRGQATKACAAGHVKIDGRSSKAAKIVTVGVTIDVLTPGGPKILEVLALGERRGPYSEAKLLYEDHTPPPPEKTKSLEVAHDRPRGEGRPSKRDRRRLDRLMNK